jgi:ubiquinone/menaquinone biosynthesis C-methylase UbiE
VPLIQQGDWLIDPSGTVVGAVSDGIARFAPAIDDHSIDYYKAIGGAQFYERSKTAFAMTALDTGVYHGYLAELKPTSLDALIVDVGGGDGRNAMPWLQWGFLRVAVVDAVVDGLSRLRARIAAERPEWLDRLLLVQADARNLPLATGIAERMIAIEALQYLNEDYAVGLRECGRVLARRGRLLVADRDYEASLLVRLLYSGGVDGLLAQAGGSNAWDGGPERLVRSRAFTADEHRRQIEAQGLRVESQHGVPILSTVLGYLRSIGKLTASDEARLPDIRQLLARLASDGRLRRTHVTLASWEDEGKEM